MEDLNLHFTGDFHAITSANNLLAAMLDNHIKQGNALNIDTNQIVWKRCMDMNDRVLRNIVVGLGRPVDGVVREDHFIISVASEIMAILCLADNMKDLKERLGRIIVAYNYDGEPVFAKDIHAVGSMAALLKDAIKPNIIQTVENTPALVHGGPFANIAHGCNSVRATRTGLKIADYCITEAGFGADLGAEKFMDIKCRMAGLKPDAVVLVATVRALKYNGGVAKEDLGAENLEALKKGIANLEKHIENVSKFGVPCVVTLNRFVSDTDAELAFVKEFCEERGCDFALSEVWENGGEGGIALAEKVLNTLEKATMLLCIRRSSRSRTRLRRSQRKSTEQEASAMHLPHHRQSHVWRSLVMVICRYVWQRISIPCRMIQSCLAVQRISQSISVRYMYLPVQALW